MNEGDKVSVQGHGNTVLNNSHGNTFNTTVIKKSSRGRLLRAQKVPMDGFADALVLIGRWLSLKLTKWFYPTMFIVLAASLGLFVYFIYGTDSPQRVYWAVGFILLAVFVGNLLNLSRTRTCSRCKAPFVGREYKSQDYHGKTEYQTRTVHHLKKHLKCELCNRKWSFDYDISEQKDGK